jgi:hypothetical protein|tara:strand:- start:11376 stop:12968 length:1593 start_codon:yes stop_codon:yes gene_type:complete
MPTIPRYDGLQVEQQVVSQPLANAPQDPNNLKAVQQFAQSFQADQVRIADTEAEEAVVAFEREKNSMFFNPENGYFNAQGRDAYDRAPQVTQDLEALKRSYSEGLSSDLARRSFDRVAGQHVTRANQDILRHSSKNLKAWEASTINAQVENTIENASLYWNDPKRLDVQRQLGRNSVLESARIEGLSPEATAEKLQTYESSFASSAVEAAVAQGSEQGQETFDRYKDRLEGPDQIKMQSIISKKRAAEKTAADSNTAVLHASNLVNRYGDANDARSQIIEEVNQIEDPELRKKTMKEAQFQLDAKMKADSEERAATFEAGENFIISGGSVDQFIMQNPDEWEKLTPKQKRTLQSGASISTDYVLLSDLLTLPKDKLAKINPTDHYDSLSQSDRTKLINAVKSARQGGVDHQTGRTRTSETTAAIEQLFGKKKNWNKKEVAQVNELYAVIDDQVQFLEQQKGSPLDSSEYTEMLNNMTRKIVKERAFWFDKEEDLTDIPAEDLRVISNYLHNNNISATAENILKAFEQASQ